MVDTAQPRRFYRDLLDSVNSLRGVKTAGAVSILPLGANFDTAGTEPEGFAHAPAMRAEKREQSAKEGATGARGAE